MRRPCAQVTRLVALLFLCLAPFCVADQMGLAALLALSFALNVCYFGLDNCASMMELPLGNDDSDVAVSIRFGCFIWSSIALVCGSTCSCGRDGQGWAGMGRDGQGWAWMGWARMGWAGVARMGRDGKG